MEFGFFLFFAVVAIASALVVVIARSPVHSALALMVSLVQVAALFILLGSPFLAVIQIFVYVGAVMVLFLFVIMMLDVREAARVRFLRGGTISTLVVLVLLGAEMLILLLGSERFPASPAGGEGILGAGSLERLSTTLFTDYLFPFEVASVILLVALVGAIVLARSEAD
ncbi:MAG: NADH-quinone oxidoreductase subunit J [Gemmatimonadetes bacterium]|nr:NADH-quinone oxidoreductase subunit J [Gemmatimonadota bacterium]